jgi:hypothetical protein
MMIHSSSEDADSPLPEDKHWRRVPRASRAILVGVLGVSIVVGALAIFFGARATPQSFSRKVWEVVLQAATLTAVGGIIAALIKKAFDDVADRRDQQRKGHEKEMDTLRELAAARREFLRRMADVHGSIEHASRLIRAHDSVETYFEQSRRLFLETSKLWEVHQDLTIAHDIFEPDDEKVRDNIKRIIDFLERGAAEYEWAYRHAKQGLIKRDSLRAMLERNRSELTWVREFINAERRLPAEYEDALDKSKGVIRGHVFARTQYRQPPRLATRP